MSAKSRGISRERDVVKLLAKDGWFAMRSPASLGAADVIALKAGERPRFIEVKANHGPPYMNFRRPAREILRLLAEQAGADAYLCHWPAHLPPKWIPADHWP